jgi:arylsulfatase A-like enzyme
LRTLASPGRWPAAHRRLLTVFSVCIGAAFLLGSGLPARASRAAATVNHRYAVIIVLDGARPGYFNLVPMPNLQALAARGVSYSNAFVGQELADTPPAHATIGTGDFPKHDGIPGFRWQDPVTHQMLNPTTREAIESNGLDAIMQYHHVAGIAERVKQADPAARIESVAGHKCYASDAMGTPAADYILCALIYHDRWVAAAVRGHLPPSGAINSPSWDVPIPSPNAGFAPATEQWWKGQENAWTMNYALWGFRRAHHPRVLMINLSETDVLGHFSSNNKVVRYLMKQFDALLGSLIDAYRRAGLLNRTDFVITADHGMSRIKTFVPFSVINQAIADAGATKVYVEHDTAAAIGLRQLSKARAVALNISRLGGSSVDATYYKVFARGRWFYRRAASTAGLSQRLKRAYLALTDTMAADTGPDVFAIFAPHTSSRQIDVHGYPWMQGHLGPQWDDQHIPLVLAGPGLKRGFVSAYPARLVDIAPTVEDLLGARSGGLDGRVLADALTSASERALSLQAGRSSRLMPIVQALERRSGYGPHPSS